MERIEGGMSLSETELTDSRNPASPSPWVALWVSGAPKVWMDMDAKITQSPGGHFKGNVNVYISISFLGASTSLFSNVDKQNFLKRTMSV